MMATTIQPSQPSAHYGYPQPPPSPPMDDTPKCSLPSISNLLVMADAGSPTTEQAPQSQPQAASTKSETRPSSSHYASSGPSRGALPPSPPMSSDASFEGYNSPATKAVNHVSAVAGQDYYYETTPPLEDVQRQNVAASTVSRVSVQSQYTQHPMAPSYMTQPPVGSYYPPTISTMPPAQPQISALYYQRPLPQAFPPLPMGVSLAPATGANPWQHHHYISPSSAASFPQSQDRYICQTCSKAFSRPSSLRIHSHSHTGEKPFKCPHSGCGKAFSVRSNMKRHERGCHNFESSTSSLH
jgi:hypothetical protein